MTYRVELDSTEDEALLATLLARVDEVAEIPRAVRRRRDGGAGPMANRHTSKQARSRYGRYDGGDPLAPPVDLARRWTRSART